MVYVPHSIHALILQACIMWYGFTLFMVVISYVKGGFRV